MALEVGIVGLQSSGKSMLFAALTGARAHGEVGMAGIPDPRLDQLAEVATILGKTEGAIKSLQHRALVSLQKQIATDPV